MKKTILVALTTLSLAAFAQGPGPGPGPGMGMGPGQGRHRMAMGEGRGDPERMEKRMRLARTLGLAEALDLEPAEALKLGETIGKFDEKRLAAHKQLHEAKQALRKAAQGEQVTAAEVDQAIQKGPLPAREAAGASRFRTSGGRGADRPVPCRPSRGPSGGRAPRNPSEFPGHPRGAGRARRASSVRDWIGR